MTVDRPVSRRMLLKGLGVTVALPWLESVDVFAAGPAAKAAPKRFACMFIGDGISPPSWWSRTSDSARPRRLLHSAETAMRQEPRRAPGDG